MAPKKEPKKWSIHVEGGHLETNREGFDDAVADCIDRLYPAGFHADPEKTVIEYEEYTLEEKLEDEAIEKAAAELAEAADRKEELERKQKVLDLAKLAAGEKPTLPDKPAREAPVEEEEEEVAAPSRGRRR